MHSSSITKASPLSAKYLYLWNHNNDKITKRRVSTNPGDYKYKSPNLFTLNALLCLHVPTSPERSLCWRPIPLRLKIVWHAAWRLLVAVVLWLWTRMRAQWFRLSGSRGKCLFSREWDYQLWEYEFRQTCSELNTLLRLSWITWFGLNQCIVWR